MKTPNDVNGLRTEMIMQNIKEEIYNGEMDVSKYNEMYFLIHKSLTKISIKNIHKSMKEMGIKLFA